MDKHLWTTLWIFVFSIFQSLAQDDASISSKQKQDISTVLEDIRNSDVIILLGFDHTRQVGTVQEGTVEAVTENVKVKSAIVDLLRSQQWRFDSRLGEPLGTAMSVQLTVKRKNGESVSISFLANSYLVITIRDSNGTKHKPRWFESGKQAKLNDVFWSDVYKAHQTEWKRTKK